MKFVVKANKSEKTQTRKEKRKSCRLSKKSSRGNSKTKIKKKKLTEFENNTNSKLFLDNIPTEKNETKFVRSLDPYIEEEDKEIRRLEKLLGLKSQNKSSVAAKLDKEYELFEGIKGSFGKFLMDLDEIAERDNTKKSFEYDDSFEDFQQEDHILQDEDQELSDFDILSDNEDVIQLDVSRDLSDKIDTNKIAINNNKSDLQKEIVSEELESSYHHTYKPIQGEDIYGRIIDNKKFNDQMKYIPPAAKSKTLEKESENISNLHKRINGLLNKLSNETKEFVLNSLQEIFRSNSINLCNEILKESIFSVCVNDSQIMVSLIPIFAGIIAGLQVYIGFDVSAYIIEELVISIHNDITVAREGKVNIKGLINKVLFLVYLYNLHSIHHDIIVDIMKLISINKSVLDEVDIELLIVIIDHCGLQLRSDDPSNLKEVISNLLKQKNTLSESQVASGRVKYMLEVIADLKNNKSKRTKDNYVDTVKSLRKWLGNVKSKIHDLKKFSGCIDNRLHVSLSELLDASKTGRWWRTGASWKGSIKNSDLNDNNLSLETNVQTGIQSEYEKLEKLAKKLRMNTSIRKDIFIILMSSRDVMDAFERINRIELKGKQDRNIAQVIIECCCNEKSYNYFYVELLQLYCQHNHQYKITIQYIYWDLFKEYSNNSKQEEALGNKTERKLINLGNLLGHLIVKFIITLNIVKIIDMVDLSKSLKLLLENLFLVLFDKNVNDELFQTIIDRLAASSDYVTTKENLLVYFQENFKRNDKGINITEWNLIFQRRKILLSTLKSMEVLDYARIEKAN